MFSVLSGQHVEISILASWVQVPLWQLAGFVLGCQEFKTLATLEHSQLLASYQLGFSNPVMFYLDFFFLIIEWSACKLAEYKMRLSALSTVNKLLTFFYKVLTTEGIHKIYYFSLIWNVKCEG